MPDESFEEKLQRCMDTIESAQNSIKEVVDGDSLTLEKKIYRVMDLRQDMDDIAELQKQCENHADATKAKDELKKASIGLRNLTAYLGQVDCTEFATSLRNEFLFKVLNVHGTEYISGRLDLPSKNCRLCKIEICYQRNVFFFECTQNYLRLYLHI